MALSEQVTELSLDVHLLFSGSYDDKQVRGGKQSGGITGGGSVSSLPNLELGLLSQPQARLLC